MSKGCENKISFKKQRERIVLRIGSDVSVELALKDGFLLGISEVKIRGERLRNGAQPIAPSFRGLSGETWRHFRYAGYSIKAGQLLIHTVAEGAQGDFEMRSDIRSAPLPVVSYFRGGAANVSYRDQVDWVFSPHEVEIEGRKYVGFGYSYCFRSRLRQVHEIFERTTWEIGGRATGNTIIQQHPYSPPGEITFRRNTTYSSKWYNDDRNRLLPRNGVMLGFDYQFSRRGILLGYFDNPGLIYTMIEKQAEFDGIHYCDLYVFDPSTVISTTTKYVTFHKAEKMRMLDGRNAWTDCFDFVNSRYRRLRGIQPETPYTMISDDRVSIDLRRLADIVLPVMKDFGFKVHYMGPIWESDQTRLPGRGNQCCPWELKSGKMFGGEPALKYFCDKAHSLGIKVIIWIPSHFSRHSSLWKNHSDWFIIGRNGERLPQGDWVLWLTNLNSSYYDYVVGTLRRLKKTTGIDGVFHDSYWNYGMIPVDWSDPKRPRTQFDRQIQMTRELQKTGLIYYVEAVSPYGMTHSGDPTYLRDEHTAYNSNTVVNVGQGDRINAEWYFRYLANKAPMRIALYPEGTARGFANHIDRLPKKIGPMNIAYNEVVDIMEQRTILPVDRGIEWRNRSTCDIVLFSYRAFRYRVPHGARVEDKVACKGVKLKSERSFWTRPFSIYLMRTK